MPAMQLDHVFNSKPLSLTLYLEEVWSFRELLAFFFWRDLVVRYKQALLGIAWVLLRPLLTIALFTFVFSTIARFPSENISYPLFVLAAMLPWQFFAACATDASATMSNHAPLIRKAYFPRLLLPLSAVAVQACDFLINLLLFLLLTTLFGATPSLAGLLLFPFLLLWTLCLCWGLSFWLAPLSGLYTDVRFLVSFAMQLGVFISPVGYGTFLIPKGLIALYALNPLVGLIDSYRFCLLGLSHSALSITIPFSLTFTSILFVSGLLYNKKIEHQLVDLI